VVEMEKSLEEKALECIKNNANMRKKNSEGEVYCGLSLYAPSENFCKYLGEPILLHIKGENYEKWIRCLRCLYGEKQLDK